MTLWTVPRNPRTASSSRTTGIMRSSERWMAMVLAHPANGSVDAVSDDYESYEPVRPIVVALEPAATSPFMDF
jgi:hypothetical protein